jgi:hypothetical protein
MVFKLPSTRLLIKDKNCARALCSNKKELYVPARVSDSEKSKFVDLPGIVQERTKRSRKSLLQSLNNKEIIIEDRSEAFNARLVPYDQFYY